MTWTPIDSPRPQDAVVYDIRLKDGRVISGVEYWDHGAGFGPLVPGEASPFGDPAVSYPLAVVSAFRPHQP